jgi:hypothetical protein
VGLLHVGHVPGIVDQSQLGPAEGRGVGRGQHPVDPAPDHGDRDLDRGQQGGGVDGLLVPVEQGPKEGLEGRLDPVQALVPEQVVDQLPVDLALVGEQLGQVGA